MSYLTAVRKRGSGMINDHRMTGDCSGLPVAPLTIHCQHYVPLTSDQHATLCDHVLRSGSGDQ